MSTSITVDQVAFITGGYGAVGIGFYTLNIYKGVPLPFSVPVLPGNVNVEREEPIFWTAIIRRWRKFAYTLSLVQLRAIERFFIGGCVYISVEKMLVAHGRTNSVINAAIAGSILGTYECGYHGTLRSRIHSISAVTGFALIKEAIIAILQRNGFLLERPTIIIIIDYDPIFYIMGALGAYAVGIYTTTFLNNIRFPNIPQRANPNEPLLESLKNWLIFSAKCLSEMARIEIRIEERNFLGSSLSWSVDHLLLRTGLKNRWLRIMITGVTVGAYFGTYGGVRKIRRSAAGVMTLGIAAELLVAPVLSKERLWEVIAMIRVIQ